MPTRAELTVAQLVAKAPPAVRPTVRAARRAVKAAAPGATEQAYRSQGPGTSRSMYKVARYVVDDAQVVGIGTFPAYAALFFRRGAELGDDAGLLEGSGASRFIRLRTPADAARPAVKRLVRAAVALASKPV
jgi:hypothetical protein